MLKRAFYSLFAALFLFSAGLGHAAESYAAKEKELIETERSFYQASLAKKGDGWGEFAADDAVTGFATGKAKIVEAMNGFYAQPGASLDWHATYAHVFGDVGVTSGPYVMRDQGKDGKPTQRTGRYVTVWRHGPDGWKYVWDGDAKN
jgi:ketosteroid isomerase-like protein